MAIDSPDLTNDVIEMTNTVGSTAQDLQRMTELARTARHVATVAARHPGRLALAGLGLLATSAVLALRPDGPGGSSSHAQAQSQRTGIADL